MSTTAECVNVGVVGCGYWGPNHVRVFSELDRAHLCACADLSLGRLARLARRFPHARMLPDYHHLLDDPDIQAVVIATPTDTHATLVREALEAGKHVLVEKPLCTNGTEADELLHYADACGLVLMVGHVFLFNAGILKLRELIEGGTLGRIHYLDAVRTNLGPIRGDVNALFDLGAHDISIFNFLLQGVPTEVSAVGNRITQTRVEDVCFATLRYPDGTLGHIHVSWLNPRKVRTLTVVGERKMAHWDDVNPVDALQVFDKGIDEAPHYDSFGEFHYLVRSGDTHLPAIRRTEPLLKQAEAFVAWVLDGTPCAADAASGRDVVAVLEAAVESMRRQGVSCPVKIHEPHLVSTA